MSNLMDNPTPADAEKELKLKFNEWMHRMIRLELLPSMIGDGIDRKTLEDWWRMTGGRTIFEMPELQSLIDAARKDGIENGIKRATGSYSYSMPMKSVRTRNTAFKLYAVKFFNGKIKERREALLLQLKNELSHPAPVHKSDKE